MSELKTYREFVQEELDSDPELQGPFCPFNSPRFGHGYCNKAYSTECFGCKESLDGYDAAIKLAEVYQKIKKKSQ